MDKRKTWRGAIELGKDILIIALACSAVWMLRGAGLWQGMSLSDDVSAGITGEQVSAEEQAAAARPISITVTIGAGTPARRGVVQYDDGETDVLFRHLAGLLVETLASVGEAESVSRGEWEQALGRAPGFCFDFQGEMPLSVLGGWLGVEQKLPETTVRRLLLTGYEDCVALYYYDLRQEQWQRRVTTVVTAVQLENALEGLSENGAYYAFESELTERMAPDTVLTPTPRPVPVCTASNPVSGGRSALEGLMQELNFNLSGSVFYPAAGEEVVRVGSDTLRLSTAGVLEYHAGESGSYHFPIAAVSGQEGLFAAVESCRRILDETVAGRCGQARMYLSRVERRDTGWHLEFEYCVDGVSVVLERGCAAEFEIRMDHITGFVLRLRSYALGEETYPVLPPVQAAAAMSALDLEGRELRLTYQDGGEERLVPQWAAVEEQAG